MAPLERIAPNLRAVFASHIALQFVDGRRLRPAHDVQGHCLMCLAPQAADLKMEIASVQCVAEAGRGLSRSFESEHALVPGDTRQTVSFLPSLGRALRRMPNRTTVNAFARFGAHPPTMRKLSFDRQAATDWARKKLYRCRSWMLISQSRLTRRCRRQGVALSAREELRRRVFLVGIGSPFTDQSNG
jgi:hypothetical protein